MLSPETNVNFDDDSFSEFLDGLFDGQDTKTHNAKC